MSEKNFGEKPEEANGTFQKKQEAKGGNQEGQLNNENIINIINEASGRDDFLMVVDFLKKSIEDVNIKGEKNVKELREKIAKIEKRIEELESKGGDNSGDLESLRKEMKELERRISERVAEIDEKIEKTKEELSNKILHWKGRITSLEKKDKELEKRISELESSLKDLVDPSLKDVEELKNKVDSLEVSIKDLERRVSATETGIDAFNQRLSFLEGRIEEMKEKGVEGVEELRREIVEIKRRIEKLEESPDDLENLRKEMKDLEKRVFNKLDDLNERITRTKSELEFKIGFLEEKFDLLQKTDEGLQAEIDQLKKKLENIENFSLEDIKNLKNEINNISSRIETLETRVSGVEAKIQTFNQRLNVFKIKIEEIKGKGGDVDKLEQEIDKIKKKIKDLEEIGGGDTGGLEELKGRMDKLEKRVLGEFASIKVKIDNNKRTLETKIGYLIDQFGGLEEAHDELKGTLNKKIKELEEGLKNLENLSAQDREKLVEEAGRLDERIDVLAERVLELEKREKDRISLDPEVVKKFEELGIEKDSLVELEGFIDLSKGQQLLIHENLKQIILGRVEDEAKKKYKDDVSESGFLRKIWKGMTKHYQIGKKEEKIGQDIIKGGMIEHGSYLKQLVQGMKEYDPEVEVEKGEFKIKFISVEEGAPEREERGVKEFNNIANEFARIPEEWRHSNVKEKRKKFEEISKKFEEAKEGLLNMMKESQGEKEAASKVNQAEYQIYANRLFNHNPEIEQALRNIQNQKTWKNAMRDTITERGAYLAGGLTARAGATALLGAVGSGLAACGAPIGASIIGGYMGQKRSKEALSELDIRSRRGESLKGNSPEEEGGDELKKYYYTGGGVEYRIEHLKKIREGIQEEIDKPDTNKEKKDDLKKYKEETESKIKKLEEQRKSAPKPEKGDNKELLEKRLDEIKEEIKKLKKEVEKLKKEEEGQGEINKKIKKLEGLERDREIVEEKLSQLYIKETLEKDVVDWNYYSSALDDLTKTIEDSKTSEEGRHEAIKSLHHHLEEIDSKIRKGEIDFGDDLKRFKNQYDFIQRIAKARSIEMQHWFSEGENNEKLKTSYKQDKKVVDEFLEKIESRVSKNRKSKIIKDALKGAGMAAGFAFAGQWMGGRLADSFGWGSAEEVDPEDHMEPERTPEGEKGAETSEEGREEESPAPEGGDDPGREETPSPDEGLDYYPSPETIDKIRGLELPQAIIVKIIRDPDFAEFLDNNNDLLDKLAGLDPGVLEKIIENGLENGAISPSEIEVIRLDFDPEIKIYLLDFSDADRSPYLEYLKNLDPEDIDVAKVLAFIKNENLDGLRQYVGELNSLSQTVEQGDNLTKISRQLLKDADPSAQEAFIEKYYPDHEDITSENRESLLEQAINKMSVSNLDMDEGKNLQNLIYEGNKVNINSETGEIYVEQGESALKARAVSESELRENWADQRARKLGIDPNKVNFGGEKLGERDISTTVSVNGQEYEVIIDENNNWKIETDEGTASGAINEEGPISEIKDQIREQKSIERTRELTGSLGEPEMGALERLGIDPKELSSADEEKLKFVKQLQESGRGGWEQEAEKIFTFVKEVTRESNVDLGHTQESYNEVQRFFGQVNYESFQGAQGDRYLRDLARIKFSSGEELEKAAKSLFSEVMVNFDLEDVEVTKSSKGDVRILLPKDRWGPFDSNWEVSLDWNKGKIKTEGPGLFSLWNVEGDISKDTLDEANEMIDKFFNLSFDDHDPARQGGPSGYEGVSESSDSEVVVERPRDKVRPSESPVQEDPGKGGEVEPERVRFVYDDEGENILGVEGLRLNSYNPEVLLDKNSSEASKFFSENPEAEEKLNKISEYQSLLEVLGETRPGSQEHQWTKDSLEGLVKEFEDSYGKDLLDKNKLGLESEPLAEASAPESEEFNLSEGAQVDNIRFSRDQDGDITKLEFSLYNSNPRDLVDFNSPQYQELIKEGRWTLASQDLRNILGHQAVLESMEDAGQTDSPEYDWTKKQLKTHVERFKHYYGEGVLDKEKLDLNKLNY